MEVTQLKGDRDGSVHKCPAGCFEKATSAKHTGIQLNKHSGVNMSCIRQN